MKQIINIQEQYGAELHTRQMMERLAASLDSNIIQCATIGSVQRQLMAR